MARTAQKVESLIDEQPEIAEALSVVLDLTDDGQGEVEWGDVRDDLSSGQWGRLIETGVLVDGDTGFRLDDPETVRGILADIEGIDVTVERDDDEADDELPEVEWTTWDKAAAAGSVLFFAGYSLGPVRNAVGTTLNLLLGPLDLLLPFFMVIMVLAMFTGLYSTLLQANLMDMEAMSGYQQRMKDIQRRQKEAKERGDDEAVEAIRKEQMEAMGDQLGMFKAQFRPMVWIMLLTIPVFLWMWWKIRPDASGEIVGPEMMMVMPYIGELTDGWTTTVIGPLQAWILWYALCSMAFTQIIRKALNIQTTPT